MASRKLNVLVYSGTGTTVDSVRHALFALRRLLSPHYAVSPVTETILLREPWQSFCALLVIPGGADLGYCRALLSGGDAAGIARYVKGGGAYLGLCAGGYFGSARCEFEVGDETLEVVGARELKFFPGSCRGSAFKGFSYGSEVGARAAWLKVRTEGFVGGGVEDGEGGEGTVPDEFRCYVNGGGVFVGAAGMRERGVEVLATYAEATAVDAGEDAPAAVVCCRVGEGVAVLTGPHPEFAGANLNAQVDVPGYGDVVQALVDDDEKRTGFLKACLTRLGLTVSQETSPLPSLSSLHLSGRVSSDVAEMLHSWAEIMSTEGELEVIRGENDTFCVVNQESRWSVDDLQKALPAAVETGTRRKAESPLGSPEYSAIVKRIITHEESWPEAKQTPDFSHGLFYTSLQEYRAADERAEDWGNVLMYGEVVTSTNTLLEKNPKLLSKLPTGFTLTATTQVAGRGRGTNVWIAPPGNLIMSTVINHPAHVAMQRPIQFIQYLAAIAVVEAIHSYGKGYQDMPVKLKWPNDIYARDPSKPASPPAWVKIGGILVNCVYSSGSYQLVLGTGINTSNARPTTSLNALVPSHLAPIRIERLLAAVVVRTESVYREFCRDGFSRRLEDRYYRHWLHSGQVVTLDDSAEVKVVAASRGGGPASSGSGSGVVRARIVGITRDHGMLRAEELCPDADGEDRDRPTGREMVLESDYNSFDFFRGLVRRKA